VASLAQRFEVTQFVSAPFALRANMVNLHLLLTTAPHTAVSIAFQGLAFGRFQLFLVGIACACPKRGERFVR
jgi:ACR3 family arsenite efflux pump ArsB